MLSITVDTPCASRFCFKIMHVICHVQLSRYAHLICNFFENTIIMIMIEIKYRGGSMGEGGLKGSWNLPFLTDP